MTSLRHLAALLGAAVLAACSKDAVQQIATPASGASIKFFNFAVPTPPATVPTVNFYANETKLTAVSSTTGQESTLGTASGGAGNGGFYSQIAAGAYTLTGKVTAATDKGLTIAARPNSALTDGKFYSFFMSGYYNATSKTTDAFVVEDPIPATIDPALAYVRFVNAAVSGTAGSAAQTLFAKNTVTAAETPVGAAVAYQAASAFVALPEAVYDLSTRATGSTANVVARTGVSFLAGRVYTVTAFGDVTITGATATNRIRLDNTANR